MEVWVPEGNVGRCAECFRTECKISKVIVDRGTSQSGQTLQQRPDISGEALDGSLGHPGQDFLAQAVLAKVEVANPRVSKGFRARTKNRVDSQ